MAVTRESVLAALQATWPPAREVALGPVMIRAGAGGGSRVSAARVEGTAVPTEAELAAAEAAMIALGQTPLFQITKGQEGLDTHLAQRGYLVKDPVHLMAAPVDQIAPPVGRSVLKVWPPLAIQAEIWATGGIGPARLAVMERATVVKTSLLGRVKDLPAGAAYVGLSAGIAMLHALEVLPSARRQGLGRQMVQEAADWARAEGASHLALAVTKANLAAIALYKSLGFETIADYHYRERGGHG